MRKTILAGASAIALLALSPNTASADHHRYHRDWHRGPDVSVGVGPSGVYIGRQPRYSYDYGPDWRYRHHYRDWDEY
jgi:hypothetical protein